MNDLEHSYLVFRLGGLLYGSPLTHIRKVIPVPSIKTVPSRKDYLRGVINLRGQIISVIDLRKKFGLETTEDPQNLILVVAVDSKDIGFIADGGDSVVTIEDPDISRPDLTSSQAVKNIPSEYFLGIGKHQNREIHLVNLAGLVKSSAD